MTTQQFLLFLISSLALNLTPGNDMLFVMSRTTNGGWKAGFYATLGIGLGCLVHIFLATLGVSVLIAKSQFWFILLKYAGVAYLLYIGYQSLTQKSELSFSTQSNKEIDKIALLKQGFITNVLNPKVGLFFISFLPQFINIDTLNYQSYLLFLGFWFDIQGCLILLVVAYFTQRLRTFMLTNPTFAERQNKITGIILISLGIKLAFLEK
jgi:threonine/homoserine/homoserine lactone efflux protein